MSKPYRFAEIRKAFLDYFANHAHTIVPSSSLIPANDPSLLFTNAGMVQFKDVFLGLEQRPYQRATTAQRCLRAGGKHNDLENVGYTARHHTFFEMLGNFSFGEYFKADAIRFAWNFLTEVIGLPKEKLWVTVFTDDDEAADIWLKDIGVDPNRLSRCGEKDNFWTMGDTGPCGPCTEIFYDHGPEVPGGPPGSPDADGDRYIEIWNLVFMQFQRSADGQLTPLPRPAVDTGMGLERLAAIVQGVHSNYETDLFKYLIQQMADMAKMKDTTHTSLRVVADHIRACSFLIADGVLPSNEGRGYVLRRIIRRAIRHGSSLLGNMQPFFYKLVRPLVEQMGEAYPFLKQQQAYIEQILLQEEEQFARTLQHGLRIFENDIAKLNSNVIPGSTVFRLYDTYGFPMDLTADMARERGLSIDEEGFHREMEKQRKQSQEGSKFADYTGVLSIEKATAFYGYEHLERQTVIEHIFTEQHKPIDNVSEGQKAAIVLQETPFYAEAGGQVGDQGILIDGSNHFVVEDTRKQGQAYVHYGYVKAGRFNLGQSIIAQVDIHKRMNTAGNHSATHLLHAALRQLLGEHVQQKGSLVEPQRLRFDFAHRQPLSREELALIEDKVNQQIRLNLPVQILQMNAQEAIASGALALFGEKYGDEVRVLKMGNFSTELCGGTHVQRTGDIGLFKIVSETGSAAGIRRIEALTGAAAWRYLVAQEELLQKTCQILKADQESIVDKAQQLLERQKFLEKQNEHLLQKLAQGQVQKLIANSMEINSMQIIAAWIDEADIKLLKYLVDQVKPQLNHGVIVLASANGQRVDLVAGVAKNCVEQIKANELIQFLAAKIDGKGGGRADMAQAGGLNPDNLKNLAQLVADWVTQHTTSAPQQSSTTGVA